MTHTARDGWKWVPVEPTEEMIAAARRNNHPRDVDTWNTMLSAAPSPPSEVTREAARKVWSYIERLLHEECGLRLDEGLSQQRPNFLNAIAGVINPNAADDDLIAAAVEFLNHGEGLHKIRVCGKLMDRKQVADALHQRGEKG